jgi:hypothetical protein
MNKYLAKLHSLQYGSGAPNPETRHPKLPSKPSKLGFEGFEGDQGRGFFENGEEAATVDPCAKHMAEDAENVTPQYPQNLQNVPSSSEPGAPPAEPSAAYHAVSPGCEVAIVELPATGLRYRRTFAHLQLKPPALVDVARWRQCVEDGKHFLAKWSEQAESLGWTSADLFGLHTPPAKPHPSYNRMSRYDQVGLIWLLEGRSVVALTADTAAIENPTGSITVYRRFNKPALGPVGDSLDARAP